ncbi:MAG: acyl carrier protein [Eubacteriales bacterium]
MFEQVKNLIVEQVGADASKITPDAKLVEDLGLDSMSLIEMITEFEDRYGIVIADDDVKDLLTVGDIVKYLEEKTA